MIVIVGNQTKHPFWLPIECWHIMNDELNGEELTSEKLAIIHSSDAEGVCN